jgi:ribokinase
MVDLTGVGDAFCGGFLAGYCKTCDPLQAVLYGNVTASIAVEGTGAFYMRDVLSGLKEARLDRIKSMIREV